MKKNFLFAILFVVFIVACKQEDSQKPIISNLIVGHNDSIFVGEGVHIDFEAIDNELLKDYRIKIVSEETNTLDSINKPWAVDTVFQEIQGLKNADVHHHAITVPQHAAVGHYHFTLVLSDKQGNVATVERELILVDEEGDHLDH